MISFYEKRLMRVLDYIHDHPADDLSLDVLADVAAFSRFHWHRVFRAMTGETTAAAVRRVRLHHASIALVQTDQSVISVACAVGYPNAASFTRAFTLHYAATPAAFRNRGELRPFSRSSIPRITAMHPINIRVEPTRRLAAMPHKGPYPEISRAFGRLSTTLAARALFADAGHMVGVFYDDPSATALADLRSHAGFKMSGTAEIDPPLETVTLPAGRHAVLTYKGPCAGLPAAYDQLYSVWLPASDELPADAPAFEVYLNSLLNTAADDLITELHLPLAPE